MNFVYCNQATVGGRAIFPSPDRLQRCSGVIHNGNKASWRIFQVFLTFIEAGSSVKTKGRGLLKVGRCLNFALLMDKVYHSGKASEKKKPSKIQAGVWNFYAGFLNKLFM